MHSIKSITENTNMREFKRHVAGSCPYSPISSFLLTFQCTRCLWNIGYLDKLTRQQDFPR